MPLTSEKATPGTYSAHTRCTQAPTSVSLKMPPKNILELLQYKATFIFYLKVNHKKTLNRFVYMEAAYNIA